MKLSIYHFIKATLLLFAFTFISCSSETPENTDLSTQGADTSAVNDSAQSSINFFYSLPSPIFMAKVFKKIGLKYREDITNSPDNVSKYPSIQSKTLNLGIYSADLAYMILHKRNQDAFKYMESINLLATDLGMASVFDSNDFLMRFKNNLHNEDSLIRVVCELKSEMDMYMKDNDQEKQTFLIFTGAWTENIYIATQLTEESNKEKIFTRVAEQKYIINTLINVSKKFQHDEELKGLFLKLNELKNLFDTLPMLGEEEKITMDKSQFKIITEKIYDLRREIVG